MIRIVYVPVGADSEVREIEDDLKTIQGLVGGYVEAHGMGREITLWCNEEGMRLELPQNGCGILGAYLFTRVNAAGDSVSLDDDEVAMIRAFVAANRQVRHSGRGLKVVALKSALDMTEYLARRQREHDESN